MVVRCEFCLSLRRSIRVHKIRMAERVNAEWSDKIRKPVISMLFSNNLKEEHVAAWLLGTFAGQLNIGEIMAKPDLLGRLFVIWRRATDGDLKSLMPWAIVKHPLTHRDNSQHFNSLTLEEVNEVFDDYDNLQQGHDYCEKTAAIVVAWYRRAIEDAPLARMIEDLIGNSPETDRILSETDRILVELRNRLSKTPVTP